MARAALDATDARKRWRARQPEKDRAHRLVEFFVRRERRAGRSLPDCATCGKSEATAKAEGGKIHAHHTDYANPLDVVWLCPTCHLTSHWATNWAHRRATTAA